MTKSNECPRRGKERGNGVRQKKKKKKLSDSCISDSRAGPMQYFGDSHIRIIDNSSEAQPRSGSPFSLLACFLLSRLFIC